MNVINVGFGNECDIVGHEQDLLLLVYYAIEEDFDDDVEEVRAGIGSTGFSNSIYLLSRPSNTLCRYPDIFQL